MLQNQIYRLLRTVLVVAGGSGLNVVKSVVKENRSRNEDVQMAARREEDEHGLVQALNVTNSLQDQEAQT